MSYSQDPSKNFNTTTAIVVTGWFFAGVLFIFSPYLKFQMSGATTHLPREQVILGIFLAFGSGAGLLSRLPWKREDVSWGLELIGWPIVCAGWGMYVFFSMWERYPSILGLIFGVSFILACSHRFMVIIRIARCTRRNVRRLQEEVLKRKGGK